MSNPNFDRIAPFYDSLSRLVYGNALRRAQAAHLGAIPEQARVLIIGGGSGWLLEQVLRQKPQAQITYLESSARMLRLAQERLRRSPALTPAEVSFRLGDENSLQSHEKFDAILTPFLLDLFPDERLQHLMDRLYAALSPGGFWLFSDFWPVQHPAPLWQRVLLKGMYTFFGLLSSVKAASLPDFERHFSRYTLQEQQRRAFYGGMVQAKLYRKPVTFPSSP